MVYSTIMVLCICNQFSNVVLPSFAFVVLSQPHSYPYILFLKIRSFIYLFIYLCIYYLFLCAWILACYMGTNIRTLNLMIDSKCSYLLGISLAPEDMMLSKLTLLHIEMQFSQHYLLKILFFLTWSWYMPRSRTTAELHSSFVFNLRKLQTDFHNGHMNLCSHQWWIKDSLSLHPLQTSVRFFDDSHLDWNEVASQSRFNSHFLDN